MLPGGFSQKRPEAPQHPSIELLVVAHSTVPAQSQHAHEQHTPSWQQVCHELWCTVRGVRRDDDFEPVGPLELPRFLRGSMELGRRPSSPALDPAAAAPDEDEDGIGFQPGLLASCQQLSAQVQEYLFVCELLMRCGKRHRADTKRRS